MRTPRLIMSAVIAAATASMAVPVAADAASSARRGDPYEVTLKASTTELVTGDSVTLKGKVDPGSQGATVVLQQKAGDNPWKDVATDTLNRKGKFSFTDTPKSMAERDYRVVKPASKKHSRGVSEPVTVTIYQWHALYDLAARSVQYVSYYSSVSMDGTDHAKSFVAYFTADRDTASIDWNLERNCIKLKATLGMSDDANDDAAARIDVVADSTVVHTENVAFPSAAPVTLDLHDVFRVGFDFTGLTTDARPAVGSPQVLCSS